MLTAAASVALYAVSALVLLALIHRRLRPVTRSAAFVLTLIPLVLTGRAVATGNFYGPANLAYDAVPLAIPGRAPAHVLDDILSDIASQILPWRHAVRESLRHARWPLWNPSILSGDILLAAAQPAPFHPATLFGLALPLPAAFTYGCALVFLFAALFMFVYLREIGLSEEAALFGASAWTLSNFLVFWIGWPVAAAIVPLPLLLVGLRRLARGEPGGFGASVSALVLAILAGHPESLLHLVSAAGVLFLFDLAASRRRAAGAALAAAAGISALALTAIFLLPILDAIPQTLEHMVRKEMFAHWMKSLTWVNCARSAMGGFYPNAYGQLWSLQMGRGLAFDDAVGAYCGAVVLALVPLAFMIRRRHSIALALLALLSFAMTCGVPGVTDFVSRLPLFDIALNGRLSGVTAFCLCALAAMGLDALLEKPGVRQAVVVAAVAVLLLSGGILRLHKMNAKGFDSRAHAASIGWTVFPLLILAAGILVLRMHPQRLAAAALFLFFLSRVAELPRLYPTFSNRVFYPRVAELASLPRGGQPYRTVGHGFDLPPNEATLYGLEDPRGYEAMSNLRYRLTYPLWCRTGSEWFNNVDDLTSPFLSLLNVRFAVAGPGESPPAGWKEYLRGSRCAVFENPAVLPRAFAPESVRFVSDALAAAEDMKSCRDFHATAWIEDPAQTGKHYRNGVASVVSREEGPDLHLRVDAQSPAWILVSETAWIGWHAVIDGASEAPIRYADDAFLIFPVSVGRHDVRLFYRPASFTWGAAITAAAAGILIFVVVRRRRKG